MFLLDSNVLSVVAILLSAFTFWWSGRRESRYQKAEKNREAFDTWVSRPCNASFADLTTAIGSLVTTILAQTSDRKAWLSNVRAVQLGQFDAWFADFNALCLSKSDDVFPELLRQGSLLVDRVFEAVNQAESAKSEAELRECVKLLSVAKQKFLSECSAHIAAARLAVK